ncbi:potassium channel family protein [Fundicoccus sp. Sow4_H7]|uniref:TrkA family potassium uptake protein n=1 Tax=Fundicoccus culcitae TaxID=2969821 RepID=A0ABY5P7Y3_9LACT|nr:TrkA family potassium uptake protein [Fundicoccus culcitae]UUX34847.1 TrkA family potassium uptake protein [Fundicoccus culcitae]
MRKNNLVGILGLGIFGSTLAKELSLNGVDVIACDLDQKNVDRLEGYLAVGSVGDFTDLDYMRELGFGQCDAIVISTGTSLEASVLGVINAKELGIDTIICKVKNKTNSKVISALGVNILVQPEKEAGLNMAQRLIHNTIEDIINLDDVTSLVEFRAPEHWIGKPLTSLDLRKRYDINIIGIRKNRHEVLNTTFPAQYIIEKDDIYVAVANTEKFEQAEYLEYLK